MSKTMKYSTYSLVLLLSTTLVAQTAAAQPSIAFAQAAAEPEQIPDPDTLGQEERIEWAKKLYLQAKEYHDAEDYYNSVIKYEQAYAFAPSKHLFAYNIGMDAWELRDCARVKKYFELFLVRDTENPELQTTAREILAKAEGNPECVTTASETAKVEPSTALVPAEDEEDPLKKKTTQVDEKKQGKKPSGLLIGGVVLTVLGVGAVGGGVGTLVMAKNTQDDLLDLSSRGVTGFPTNFYNDDVTQKEANLKTLNTVSPILLAAGGALLAGGVAMIVVDRIHKKKGKGHYARQDTPKISGFGFAPTATGAHASLFVNF